jgi:hypothetical protein
MSLIRVVFWLAIIIFLLPTDDQRQAQISGTASAAFERAVTFCDRNPSTCATASELWVTFVRKAEFGMEQVARMLRDRMSGSPQRQQEASDPGQVRFEPVPPRGTLTSGDLAPQWRGQSARTAY